MVPNNKLTYPTVNVFMPKGDKIIPRGGSLTLGQDHTANYPIIGHFKKYKNISGIEMEMRVWNDPTMTLAGIVGFFVAGETITGGSSGATAKIDSVVGSVITFINLVGTFYGNETVTGGTSAANGTISIYKGDVVEILYQGIWQQISPNVNNSIDTWEKGVNHLGAGNTRTYFFDQWIDTNLNPALSINTNRAVWVMGLAKIRSWTGGIAPIVSIVPNTSITTTAGITWSSLGFPDPVNGGTNQIVVNGVTYTISSGYGTDTLLLANTVGITAGDTAFSGIKEISTNGQVMDYISGFKNYLTYGNWLLQKFYLSNNFNRSSSIAITGVSAVQNDLVIDESIPYSGTGHHVFRVNIDSVNPTIRSQTFSGTGLNNIVFNSGSYSGTAGAKNVYTFAIIADTTIFLPTPSTVTVGDSIVGNTSGATGIVVGLNTFGGTTDEIGVKMVGTVSFINGETITPSSTGVPTAPITTNYVSWFQYAKNGVVVNINTGLGSFPSNPLFGNTVTLTDGLTITNGNVYGHAVGDTFMLTINVGGADTFTVQLDGGAPSAPVAITTGAQVIGLGVTISFVSKNGHAIGDYWDITVDQAVINGWGNFYYTYPARKPGEGYIGQLPANFWTMAPQEDVMYINDASGKWGYLETILSADLLTETIRYTPLKQKGRNKVIFPYMIGYLDNNIAYVTEDKNLDFIGRKELIELPQISHLSNDVQLDFLAATFLNGSIEYNSLRFYVTTPQELLMFCWDVGQGYWQPPQLIPENGILSEVGLDLISHSPIRNKTNTLFVGKNDNGSAFPITIRTGYNVYGDRWQVDTASLVFVEGYMNGNPALLASVLQNVNGCLGIQQATVDPVYCIASDRAPIGYGSLGSHSHGSDGGVTLMPYFQWIGTGQSPFKFYMAAMQLDTSSKDPDFEILSLGLNTVAAQDNNSKLKRNQVKLI